MAKSDEAHFLRFSLIAVFLVAVLTVLAIVALVVNSTPTSIRVATGSEFAEAAGDPAEQADENLAGDLKTRPKGGQG